MFNVSAFLLDDASKRATLLTNSAINQIKMLRQFAPLGEDRLLQLVDCREYRPSVEEYPKPHNGPDLSPGCLGSHAMSRSMLISGIRIPGLTAWSDISQGNIATHLRCGGIYSDSFITNYLLILTVKEFWKSVDISWNYKVYKNGAIFGPPCIKKLTKIISCSTASLVKTVRGQKVATDEITAFFQF